MCINFPSKSNTVKHQQANFSSAANTKVEGSVQLQVIQVNARGLLGAPTVASVAEFQRNMFRKCFEKCKLLLECSAGHRAELSSNYCAWQGCDTKLIQPGSSTSCTPDK